MTESPTSPPATAASPSAGVAADADHRRRFVPPLLLALATVAVLLPFINKPFHLDDPMYLWVADQIRRRPLDFYGFAVNWHGVTKPMPEVMQNPPLASYYIALIDAIFGRSERALHAGFMLPAVAAVLGTYFLARELGARTREATFAALLMLLTPVFLISASSVMVDVMMLAWWMWAAWAWVRGIERERAGLLWLTAALLALAALTKYFGAALIPLLLVYGWMRRGGRRPGMWALPLLLPIAVLVAFELWTRHLYGRGLLLDAGGYATASRGGSGAPPLTLRLLTTLSFIGGGCITIALALYVIAAAVRIRTALTWIGALAAVLVALLAWDPFVRHPIRAADDSINGLFWAQLALFITAGAGVLAAGIAAVRRHGRRDAAAVMLLLWIFGTLTFAAALNWTVSGRSILPIAPAAALLAARRLGEQRIDRGRATALVPVVVVLMIGAAVSMLCVHADAAHADAARRAALAVHQRYANQPRPIFFLGHWGFQHYMEQHGGRALDPLAGEARGGDLIVQPLDNAYTMEFAPAAPNALPVIFSAAAPRLSYLATMDDSIGAGFYSDGWGPLPFAFGRAALDRYLIKRIDGPIRPVPRQPAPPPPPSRAPARTDTGQAGDSGRTAD